MGSTISRVFSITLIIHLAVNNLSHIVLDDSLRALGTRSTTRQFAIPCDPHHDQRGLAEGGTWVPLQEFDNDCHLGMN